MHKLKTLPGNGEGLFDLIQNENPIFGEFILLEVRRPRRRGHGGWDRSVERWCRRCGRGLGRRKERAHLVGAGNPIPLGRLKVLEAQPRTLVLVVRRSRYELILLLRRHLLGRGAPRQHYTAHQKEKDLLHLAISFPITSQTC